MPSHVEVEVEEGRRLEGGTSENPGNGENNRPQNYTIHNQPFDSRWHHPAFPSPEINYNWVENRLDHTKKGQKKNSSIIMTYL